LTLNPITEPTDDETSATCVAEMPFHPVADLFPLMTDDEYEKLKADIKANGLLVVIWAFKGMIIDGRNRYRACLELSIEPRFQE
jgi:ParB-like chromosome segregation protein Spo0J